MIDEQPFLGMFGRAIMVFTLACAIFLARLLHLDRLLHIEPAPDYERIKQLEIELGIVEPDAIDMLPPIRQKYTVPNNGQPPQGPYEEPWLRDISGG